MLKSTVRFLGVFGSGGFAREVMPIAKEAHAKQGKPSDVTFEKIFFVEIEPQQTEINGSAIISEHDFEHRHEGDKFFSIAIGDFRLRKRIADACTEKGYIPFSLISESATIYDEVEIGEGAIISANCILTSNIRIGVQVHLNLGSYVAHDCVIGDFVTFAPGVKCNGHVHIHDGAYIGTGAIIRPGVKGEPLVIGENSVVGMGAVVTRSVPAGVTVVGNPARPLVSKKSS